MQQVIEKAMREIMRTNDAVVLSFAESLLNDAGLVPMVADRNISVLEGSIGIFPRRVLVPEWAWDEAFGLLKDAGLGAWVVSDE